MDRHCVGHLWPPNSDRLNFKVYKYLLLLINYARSKLNCYLLKLLEKNT